MKMQTRSVTGAIAAIGMLVPILSLAQQPGAETYTATASVKSPTATAAVQVTIRIDRFVSDAEREKVMAVVKGNDQAATRRALEAAADIGYIAIGARRTPIKYAYARSTGDGRLVTVVTAQPILHLGGSAPDAKPKAGYDLALALLVLDAHDTGNGELAPAAKVKMDSAGAIVTDDYGAEVVRLTKIARVK